jgi:hypothetical protein
MSLDFDTLLRVIDACELKEEPPILISLVIPRRGGGAGQVFLDWVPGKTLKEYLRTPVVHEAISLFQAAHSRIVDHRNIKRRLSHVPQPGDELRFVRTAPARGIE